MVPRIFMLSPASTGGKRAELLFNDRATFDLARRIRTREGAPIGEVFSFLSGLYFRGKLTYATAFAAPPRKRPGRERVAGAYVITPDRGLLTPDTLISIEDLKAFARVDVDPLEPRYRIRSSGTRTKGAQDRCHGSAYTAER